MTQLNNNVVVIGASGAGKTRSIVIPNLLQAAGSYVVSDPKGNLARDIGPWLEASGYRVVCIDFIHPDRSLHYNPLQWINSTDDVLKVAHMFVNSSYRNGYGRNCDPFWDEATTMLLTAVIGYMYETCTPEERTFDLLRKLIKEFQRTGKTETSTESLLKIRFDRHRAALEKKGYYSWAAERFDEVNSSPSKTHMTIQITTHAKLATLDTVELRQMFSGNDIDPSELARQKTALFVQVSDTDRSKDTLVNIFYTQLMNALCEYADTKCEDSRLPVPVSFILDDFATNARIDKFENMIANIRSRGISAMLMIQSEAQLREGYGDSAATIMDNCSSIVYMGGNNTETAGNMSIRADKSRNTMLNMPVGKSWIFRRWQEPVLCENFPLEEYKDAIGFDYITQMMTLR